VVSDLHLWQSGVDCMIRKYLCLGGDDENLLEMHENMLRKESVRCQFSTHCITGESNTEYGRLTLSRLRIKIRQHAHDSTICIDKFLTYLHLRERGEGREREREKEQERIDCFVPLRNEKLIDTWTR